MWILVLQRIGLDLFLDIVYFPVWWYTGGAKQVFLKCIAMIRNTNQRMAPGLWLKNLFVPMFGQTDWQGRIMSVFIRFINFVVRFIGLFIWSLIILALFFVWLLVPVVIFIMFFSALFA
jgi:hypothetical protein